MIVYGGQNCFVTSFSDVWVLTNANGLGGTPTWIQLSPLGGGPGIREIAQSIAYDKANNILIIFGDGGTSGRSNDVWVLSNANGSGGTPTWTQLSTAGTLPPPRGNNSAVYDPASNRFTIFGGSDTSGNPLGDTWVLTNANGLGGTPTWSQIASSSTDFPEARGEHTAVYNSSTNRMTVFGGAIVSCCGPFANNVWVLNHANGL